MTKPPYRRLPLAALFAFLTGAALVGCRSHSKNDLYRQRMASEIRVLEDQLYDADYQNRVLRDKLERQKIREAEQESRRELGESRSRIDRPALGLSPPVKASPLPDEDEPAVEAVDIDTGEPLIDDLELMLPEVDTGIEMEVEPLVDPAPGFEQEPSAPQRGEAEVQPEAELLPAPSGPQPPGKKDTNVPPVIPGEVLPPPVSPEEIKPPGQIQLPDSVQSSEGVPQSLRIHRSLSGGHRIDDEVDGMMVVVNVVDKLGKTIDVSRFDIDAELSVVVLDPLRDPSEARIGRWDFSSEQVASMVRSEPISGLHVPIDFKGIKPSGKEVIVHARLRGEEDEMRCHERIRVEQQPATAQWTPRGEALR